jgi:predicted TPR repeat methyltransferase
MLDADPLEPTALQRLAWLEDDLGNTAVAIDLTRRLIGVKPDDARGHLNLGLLLKKAGQPIEAVEMLRKATQLNPQYAAGFCNLGLLLEETGDLANATDAMRQAAALQPQSDFIAYHLAAMTGQTPPAVCPPDYLVPLFDGYADQFDAHLFEKLNYRGPELLAEIVTAHQPGPVGDVLDLGCGTGMSGAVFRDRAKSVTGVDLSPRMLQHASRRTTAQGRRVYDLLVQADVVRAMRDRVARFDLILAADVLIYIGDLQPLFSAAFACLRAGGLVGFTTESTESGDYLLQRNRRYAHGPVYVERTAEAAGLKLLERRAAGLRVAADGGDAAGNVYLFQKP